MSTPSQALQGTGTAGQGATSTPLSRTAAVVVHHKNFPEVVGTIERLIAGGIEAARVVVVDNSEDPVLLEQLRGAAPQGVRVLGEPNEGYGHAVNVAIGVLAAQAPEYVVISTHETRPEPGAIALMVEALAADPAVGAVGPTLVTGEPAKAAGPDGGETGAIDAGGAAGLEGLTIWSMGGRCTRVLGEPRHFGEHQAWDPSVAEQPIARRHWVDGAFVAYRFDALVAHPLREDFFLYYEETDLHRRLRDAGHLVLWVPSAVVWQSSGGAPPFLQARNLQRYQRAHGTRLQAAVTVPWVMLRAGIRKAVRGGKPHQRRDMLRGWRQA